MIAPVTPLGEAPHAAGFSKGKRPPAPLQAGVAAPVSSSELLAPFWFVGVTAGLVPPSVLSTYRPCAT